MNDYGGEEEDSADPLGFRSGLFGSEVVAAVGYDQGYLGLVNGFEPVVGPVARPCRDG